MKTPQLKEVVDYFFVEKTEPDDEVVFDKEVIEFVARVHSESVAVAEDDKTRNHHMSRTRSQEPWRCWKCGETISRCKHVAGRGFPDNGVDGYGEPVTGIRRRAKGCKHPVPCLVFLCTHPEHEGSRRTPWCRGHDVEEIDKDGSWCDDCWFFEVQESGADLDSPGTR